MKKFLGILACAVLAAGAYLYGANAQINAYLACASTSLGSATTFTNPLNTTLCLTAGVNIPAGSITATTLTTDSSHTTQTVCEDTTSKVLYFGSGSAGVCAGTSSARFKHDIEPLDAGLSQIMALKPSSYYLNADHGDPTKKLYGFIAEDAIGPLPDLVGLDMKGKPNSMDYLGVVPVAVRAIQQQQQEIAELKAQIAALTWQARSAVRF